jgi:hypothetical protein
MVAEYVVQEAFAGGEEFPQLLIEGLYVWIVTAQRENVFPP